MKYISRCFEGEEAKKKIYVTIATFTVIVTLVKRSDDVHWNVWTNI